MTSRNVQRRLLCAIWIVACLLVPPWARAADDAQAPPVRILGYARVAGVSLPLDSREKQWLAEHPVLTVGILPNDLVPFDIVGLGNEYEGISADYLDAIAGVLHLELKVRTFGSAQEALAALARGEVDMLPTMQDAAAGGDGVALSPPYFSNRHVQVVAPERRVDKSAEATVGYVPGHVSPDALRRAYPRARLVSYSSVFLGLSAAAAGKLDVFVDNGPSVAYLIDQYQLLSLRPADFGDESSASFHFAMRAHDSLQLRLVERALGALPARTRNEIKVRWSPTYEPAEMADRLKLSEAERQWIAAHPKIRYAAVEDRMPFIFVDQSGRFDGLSVQVLDLIAAKTGLAFQAVEPRRGAATAPEADNSMDMLPVVVRGTVPVPGMAVTDAYFQGYWVVVSRAGDADFVRIEDLAGKRIAYLPPNGVVDKIKERVPSVRLVPVASIAASYEEVAAGKADATVGNINTASYLIQHKYEDRLKVAGALGDAPIDIAFAVRSSYPELLSIINKALESVPPEEMRRLRSNWMFLRHPATDWSQYYHWAYGIGGALLLCLGIFVFWNRSLQKQVQRTLAVEARLRDELAFRNAMLDGMPHAVCVRDWDLRLTLSNSAFRRAYNVDGAELHGMKPSDPPFMGGSEQAAADMEKRYRRVLDEGASVSEDIDLSVNGQALKVFHWAAPISLTEGGPRVALVTGGVDVTPRYRLLELVDSARAKAESADRAKSNFLATMSHEIRSPMHAVIGVLELLLRKAQLDAQDQESIELAHSAARSLLGLIDDILDMSKIEAGGLEIVPRPTQLRRIVGDVAHVFESLARQRGLTIDFEIDTAVSQWHSVDGLRLRQILNNLVSNAIKYTDTGGVHVQLRLLRRTSDVESIALEVEDTGIGIAPEDLPNLFKPFFQAESAGPRTAGGTGLGLPIVQRLCTKMGGDISVHSAKGKGTRVCASFDLAVVAAPETAAAPAGPGGAQAPEHLRRQRGRYNILVVDDHPANRVLLQRQLEHLGFRCQSAQDGAIGLRKWQEDVFDLVITDCSMPVMDGYTFTMKIREQERGRRLPHCPVLGYTAHVQEDELRRAIEVGMDECLVKPIGIDQLLQALVRHLHEDEALAAAPAAAQAPDEDAPFDVTSLKDFSGGDAAVEADFLEALLRTNLTDRIELQALAGAGALREAASCAHKIKGAARIIRAQEVIRACEHAEAAFGTGDLSAAIEAADAVSEWLERLNAAISARLHAHAATPVDANR